MFAYFCHDTNVCYYNVLFITLNLILCTAVSLLSISPKIQEHNPRTGLLQSGVVAVYATYLILSSLLSEPSDCNPYNSTTDGTAQNLTLFLGAIFTIIAVCYSTIRIASSTDQLSYQAVAEEQGETTPVATEDGKAPDDETEQVTYSYFAFHLTFALGAMYVGELLTDWQMITSALTEGGQVVVDFGWTAVWIKIVSSWIVLALYLWTVVAPMALPNREWGN